MSRPELLRDVALRPWPAAKKEEIGQQDLLLQIEQLTNERGHLRDITEKSLQEDIDAGKDLPENIVKSEDAKKDEKKVPSKDERLQVVFRAQQEIASHLEWAKFAANNAVDLLSLILSSDPNKRSATSFSHNFRKEGLDHGVPFGSFGISRENHDQHVRKPDEIQSLQDYEQRQELVAKGARMDALDTATDELLKAAKNLEREVRRETKYWQEIVSISDKGWPIQRIRQNARNVPFAVRYGLPEASNHFKARGLAPLRMNKDGSIILDPALAIKPKTLRVRVSENGKVTGTSHLTIEGSSDDLGIEKTIQMARDSLFEEELYHEMSLETRQLLAYGVEYRDSVIHLTSSGANGEQKQRMILIDCIPRDERLQGGQDSQNDWLAQTVAEGLRLLLAHEHSMRLYRRSQLPPALTGKKRENPSPPLLRTLLAIFRHLEGVDSLYGYLGQVAHTLQGAGMGVTLESTRETAWATLAESLSHSSKTGMSATDQLLDMFTKPFNGRATLTLPSSTGAQPEDLIVTTRTTIGQPTFGTEHTLVLPSSLTSDLGLFRQMKFSSVSEVKSYLDWVLSLHVAHRQLKSDFSQQATIKGNEPRITIQSKPSKKGPASGQDIIVALEEGKLRVTAVSVNQEGTEGTPRSYEWEGKGGEISLAEKITDWVG